MAYPLIPTLGIQNNEQDAVLTGRMFIYSSAAAGVLAKAADASPVMMLWNPSDSGVNLRINEVRIGAVSGTVILAHLAYGILLNAGAQIGTAAPVVSFTAGTPVNGLVGAGRPSRIRFAPATTSLAVAPTYMMPSGFSSGGALAAGPLNFLIDKIEGKIVIPPGVAFFAFLSNGAMALTAAVSVIATEEPVLVSAQY
jgi:hypothetical protein